MLFCKKIIRICFYRAEEAYSDSYEAVLRDPNNQKALYRQAFALNKLGLKAKARKKLERCIELDPKNVEARQLFSSIPADVVIFLYFIRKEFFSFVCLLCITCL